MRWANCLAESKPSGSTIAFLAWTQLGSMGLSQGLLGGQKEGQNADSFARLFNLLVVLANPGTYQLTPMPGGIVPDQQPGGACLVLPGATTPLQKLGGDRTHRSSRDKAQRHLLADQDQQQVRVAKDAIAGQGFGIRIILFARFVPSSAAADPSLCQACKLRQSKAAPPHFVEKAQSPSCRLLAGLHDQPVACVFFSRYCGSG